MAQQIAILHMDDLVTLKEARILSLHIHIDILYEHIEPVAFRSPLGVGLIWKLMSVCWCLYNKSNLV